jgi:tRNA pseudouridine13 synthase
MPMIIKQQPGDFQVEELTDLVPGDQGAFGYYRLEKTGWTTPDALAAIRRRWKVYLRRLAYGGLKDRHAHTIQYLTIFHGPRRNLTHQGIKVTWLGQVREPFSSHLIRANRFQLILRRMSEAEVAAATIALEEVRACGVPNYFDDQRFGSVASGTGFMARHLLFGRFEDALRQVNRSTYGLQAGVFTSSLEHALGAFDELEVGGVIVNDVPTWRIDHMPYGGVKDSGLGREGPRYTIEEMTELKLMVINRP